MPHGGTHPVAHEGNPRKNSITITGGSVLSDAILTVLIPSTGAVIPAPPLGQGGIHIRSLCDNVFDWPGKEDGDDPMPFVNVSIGVGGETRYKSLMDVDVSSSQNCYGVMYKRVDRGAAFALTGTEVAAPCERIRQFQRFGGLVSGLPRIGIVSWIDADVDGENLDIENFTGIGVVADWITETSYVCVWNGESLGDLPSTILGTLSFATSTPAADTDFVIDIMNDDGLVGSTSDDKNLDAGYFRRPTNIFVSLLNSVHHPYGKLIGNISHTRSWIGLVSVGNKMGIKGTANFSGEAVIDDATLDDDTLFIRTTDEAADFPS